MAARFEALDAFLDDALELPVPDGEGGTRVWRIPSPPAEDGLRVERLLSLAARVSQGLTIDDDALGDDEEIDLYRLALGDVYDELREAGVSWTWLRHVAMTSVAWITGGQEHAARYWATAGDPSRQAPANRATRRAQQKPRTSGGTGSAGASATRSRGSTSGTRAGSSKSSSPKAAKRAGGK
jgi:hypothetical protein